MKIKEDEYIGVLGFKAERPKKISLRDKHDNYNSDMPKTWGQSKA